MAGTAFEAMLPLPPAAAFDLYVNQIDVWWPRRGVFPYSFAPKNTAPARIQFEPTPGGRFFETFADGTQYEIGRITRWQPPVLLVYTWRDPTWPGATTITATFSALGEGSRFRYQQEGFAAAGVPDLPPFYAIGNRQTMAGFVAHCHAVAELKALGAA